MAQGKVLPEILAQQGAHAEARGDSLRTGGGGGGGGGDGGGTLRDAMPYESRGRLGR